jgi:GntR family transcriptional regulator/MocR family aminotransferase
LSDWHSPFLTQATVAAFITEGHYARHIRRARRLYAERRTRLIGEIERQLTEWLDLLPSGAGLHFAAVLRHGLDPDTIAEAASTAGICILPMPGGLTFGIGSIEAADIDEATATLGAVLRHKRGRGWTPGDSANWKFERPARRSRVRPVRRD